MSRRRVVGVVTALVCVTVVALGTRVSEESADYAVHRAPLGVLVDYDAGRAGVDAVEVGTRLVRNGQVTAQTTGVFVALRLHVQAPGTEEVRFQQVALLAQGSTSYAGYGLGSTVGAEPGFETTRLVLFEVSPGRITDLTFEGRNTKIVSGFHQRLQVHLGITAANAAGWAAAAQGREIAYEADEVTRGLG
ncbi:MAG: hypothetical protein JWP61_2124 [Friedmanniella sp.]|nr:hypothetical protein [Friedmanniella sp.]